jgi:hypothetical protein
VHITITNKGTLFGSKFKLSSIIGAEIRPTCTTEHTKHGIIRFFLEKMFIWCRKIKKLSWCAINEICGSKESFIPKFKRHGGL